MGRIKGYYEWEDDSLTPADRKNGGLHQNLFDQNGNLKGHARFVPAEESDEPGPVFVTENVYLDAGDRRAADERDEVAELVARVVWSLAARGADVAVPLAKDWWRESGRHAFARQRDRLRDLRPRRRRGRGLPEEVQSSAEVATVEVKPQMSSAEAKARIIAAHAAQAFSAEQLRLVSAADIVGADGIDGVISDLAELDAEALEALITGMVLDPTLLSERSLAELSSVLGRRQQDAVVRRRL